MHYCAVVLLVNQQLETVKDRTFLSLSWALIFWDPLGECTSSNMYYPTAFFSKIISCHPYFHFGLIYHIVVWFIFFLNPFRNVLSFKSWYSDLKHSYHEPVARLSTDYLFKPRGFIRISGSTSIAYLPFHRRMETVKLWKQQMIFKSI